MKKPKILIYDIETTPNLAYVWGKYEQNVLAYQKERELLSFAYKWYGQSKIHCLTRQGKVTDKKLVYQASLLLNQADITIAHNGDKFDRRIIKSRLIKHYPNKPLKINCSVDTRSAARAYFGFNGNSLNDLCGYLSLGTKLETPGITLWLDCMRGSASAWKRMIEYNKHDVYLLDLLYTKLLPWIENHPNIARLIAPLDANKYGKCPVCIKSRVIKNGFRATSVSVQQRWDCLGCGKKFTTPVKK